LLTTFTNGRVCILRQIVGEALAVRGPFAVGGVVDRLEPL
jgi:hypothetical protein